LFVEIDAMRERIRRERGTGLEILDFKTGLGGMVEAEFLVQGLQMRAGIWNSSFPKGLRLLGEEGALAEEEVAGLQQSYHFLRRCESVLRRSENKAVAALPPAEEDQRKLALRLGAKDLSAFGDEYRAARECIHSIYLRRFSTAS